MKSLSDEYPFPIAFAFRESVLEAPNDEQRVRGVIQTFTIAIQYAALICATEYAYANYSDESLSWSLERLKRPLISDFFQFVAAAASSFKRHGVSPLVSELDAFVGLMEQLRVNVPVMIDNAPREQSLLLRRALVELRNTLGHKLYRANWGQLAEWYIPHLVTFLQAMEWCASYPLLRVVAEGQMVRMMGASPQFEAEAMPGNAREELARTKQGGAYTGLLLADAALTRLLNVYPLMLVQSCEECQAEPLKGLTEEPFLFNGDEGKYLVYLGVRHGRNTELTRDAVDEIYRKKKVQPPVIRVRQVTVEELSRRAARQSEALLAANVAARRYMPRAYQRRAEIEDQLKAFVLGDRAGFCLLGESGIGKTSLLCRKVEDWRASRTNPDGEETPPGDIVLYYPGKGLFAQGDLEARIVNDLYLEGSFHELLGRLSPTGLRLIIVIDGVNEDPDPATTLQGVCQFVRRHGLPAEPAKPRPPLKVVFSFRSAVFDKTLHALNLAGDGDEAVELLPPDLFFTRAAEQQGRRTRTYRFVLDRMSVEEAGALYEAYRALAAAGTVEQQFRPHTPFTGLSQSTRQLLTNPWYLRMVLEAFNGRQVPDALWAGKMLEEFCAEKIYGRTAAAQDLLSDRAEFVTELVGVMRSRRTATVLRGDSYIPPRLARGIAERQLALSPYLQLLDEGVLMESAQAEAAGRRVRTRYHIRFAFDQLFEYLLSENFLAEAGGWTGLSGARLASLLEEGEGFHHLTAAVELLMLELAQQGSYALLADTLNVAEKWTAQESFIRVLGIMAETAHANLEALVGHLAEHGDAGKSVSLLTNAAAAMWEKQLFAQMLLFTDAAGLAVGRAAPSDHREHVEMVAAAFMNKGVALRRLGRLGEAVTCFDETIRMLSANSDETAPQSLFYLAKAMGNKGLALDDLGYLEDAIGWYDHSIDVYQFLTDPGGTSDLSRNLAGTLKNKADALIQTGRYAEALTLLAEAIRTLEQFVTDGARAELATELSSAYGSNALALKRLDRYDEAAESHDRAIAIYRRLIEEEGRIELSRDLAGELMNKGNLFGEIGQPLFSVACYEEANSYIDRLVEVERLGPEVFTLMSRLLFNKGVALKSFGLLSQALSDINTSVEMQEKLVEAGLVSLTPRLLKGLGISLELHRMLDDWEGAAVDVLSILNHTLPFLRMKSPPPSVQREFRDILNKQLRNLSEEEREKLYAGVGEFAGVVRRMIEATESQSLPNDYPEG